MKGQARTGFEVDRPSRAPASVDLAQIEAMLQRFSTPRLQLGRAIAIDGKRVRGASRHGTGHCEVATMVGQATRAPLASLAFHDKSGEIATVRALLEEVPVAGRAIAIDALHATRDTAASFSKPARPSLFAVKENAPETCTALTSIDWKRSASVTFEEPIDKAHSRIEQRRIDVPTLPPLKAINYPGVAQVFRLTRVRIDARHGGSGARSEEQAYGITSAPDERASPEELLA